MFRRSFVCLAVLFAVVTFVSLPWDASAQKGKTGVMNWIWYDEGDPLSSAPAETRYFRRAFDVQHVPKGASVSITADNRYTVWLNGKKLGSGEQWQSLDKHDASKQLVKGKNVLAVEAGNDGGPAGLTVRLSATFEEQVKFDIFSDGSWKASKEAAKGWQNADFDDSKWQKAKVLGAYGKVGPWGGGGGGGSPGKPPVRKFTVPEGYRVEEIVKRPDDRGAFSLVNMCFDGKGRLLVSHESGGILLCTKPNDKGVLQDVRDYCTQVKNCHGMTWVKDALYLVGNGPKGTGLYRCRDTKKADSIDEVTLIHSFSGGMGEHGPHAVVHGPDDQLYVVVGNHAFAKIGPKMAPNPDKLAPNSPLRRWPTGGQGPDQGQKGSTEDVLLPRLNDANGHAAGLRAPGGTIWRMDLDGKNVALVAAGFRNQFDAAFSPNGELFSFDSDMEWDEGLPWYRPVRAVHVPMGAEFGWRTGASKIPPYALDTLPPLVDTGRGSPVGVTFCDDERFGKKYRGAFFMADWSIGVIYAVHLKRKGATYEGKTERFCVGSPMPVSDLEFAKDGSLVFTVGGRGSQGGVYRVVSERKEAKQAATLLTQPLAAWSRTEEMKVKRGAIQEPIEKRAFDPKLPSEVRLRELATESVVAKHHFGFEVSEKASRDAHPEIRALDLWEFGKCFDQAKLATLAEKYEGRELENWLLIVNALKGQGSARLPQALADKDALVRRRACEALLRAGIEPDVKHLWPLLSDSDHFVCAAARLVLERIDAKKWIDTLSNEKNDLAAHHAIIALCKSGQADTHAKVIFERLKASEPKSVKALLDYTRTVQLACFHVTTPPAPVKDIAATCDKRFPHGDASVDRELAILLTHFRRTKVIDTEVHLKLLLAMETSKDRPQQIHYFYCLRLLQDGWTKEQKTRLAGWYDGTQSWNGGNSYRGFLSNIFRDALKAFDDPDRKHLIEQGEKMPHVALTLVRTQQAERKADLLPALQTLAKKLESSKSPRINDLRRGVEEAIFATIGEHPKAEHYEFLLKGLDSSNKVALFNAIAALRKLDAKPKADDGKPYRAALEAARKLDANNRWQAVLLLRKWSADKQFGHGQKEATKELAAWGKWFSQSFPKEPALPGIEDDKPTPSKYEYKDLLTYLTTGAGKSGNVERGKKVFEKAQCLKCHKFGKEGEALGPDLSNLAKRFKRADTLESLTHPSKIISDQYRSTTIETKKGQRLTGLVATQGDTVTVLQNDGNKVTLRKQDIESQFASLVSVMPEKLLDLLSKDEIADLFAYLDTEPAK